MGNLLPAPSPTAMPGWGRRGKSVTSSMASSPSPALLIITVIMMMVTFVMMLAYIGLTD